MIFEAMLAKKNILLLNPERSFPINDNSGEKLIRDNIIKLSKGSDIRNYLNNIELFNKQNERVENIINKVYQLTDGFSGTRAAIEILKLMDEEAPQNQENYLLRSIRQQVFGI